MNDVAATRPKSRKIKYLINSFNTLKIVYENPYNWQQIGSHTRKLSATVSSTVYDSERLYFC